MKLFWIRDTGNQLTKVDLSRNRALKVLYCRNNKIYSLDLSMQAGLKELNCALPEHPPVDAA